MNKQELIKEFEEIGIHGLNMFGTVVKVIPTETAIDLIKQLDEPKPVKVPQCVADWIEVCKEHLTTSLYTAMSPNFMKENNQSFDFILWIKKTSNQETFARAWLDGYEAEKEAKYRVKLKNTNDYLNETEIGFHFYNNWKNNKTFTRKELEYSDFSWVLDCPGIEMEEVDDEL